MIPGLSLPLGCCLVHFLPLCLSVNKTGACEIFIQRRSRPTHSTCPGEKSYLCFLCRWHPLKACPQHWPRLNTNYMSHCSAFTAALKPAAASVSPQPDSISALRKKKRKKGWIIVSLFYNVDFVFSLTKDCSKRLHVYSIQALMD